MKTLATFLSRIMLHVAGCPNVTAEQALLDAAIEFCEKTLVIQQTLEPLYTEEGIAEYELTAPSNQSVVIHPTQVWFKTQLLQPVAAAHIQNAQAYNTSNPGFQNAEGYPRQYFWLSPGLIGLYPVPDTTEADALTVRAALKPSRTASQLEDVLYDNWLDPLVAGTLARLHMMKDQPWASADRALLAQREFRAGIQRARIESSTGRVRGSVSVNLRRGFA